ncbi:hypothetical protein [Acinetobacter lactucae]|uniref:hypothetical protein n=1 Tax=Acinetobacter lactucae TaxID=1785128 RepID=UPI0015F4F695|nr:hypothetical protein [Acinetobacter lactucae]
MRTLLVPSRSGRTGEGHPRVCWLSYQSANPLSFCHHNSNVLAELIYKELALDIHYFLAAFAKSYNNTA